MDESKILQLLQQMTVQISTLQENVNQRLNVIESVVNIDAIAQQRVFNSGIESKMALIINEVKVIVDRIKKHKDEFEKRDDELLAMIQELELNINDLKKDLEQNEKINDIKFGLNKDHWLTLKNLVISVFLVTAGAIITVIVKQFLSATP